MNPDFGCGIRDFVFESISSTTRKLIEQTVREALIVWEPRITLIEVSTVIDEIDIGKLLIKIEYSVIATNNRFNMVYPFYLKEGA